jgi:hypothetical protein
VQNVNVINIFAIKVNKPIDVGRSRSRNHIILMQLHNCKMMQLRRWLRPLSIGLYCAKYSVYYDFLCYSYKLSQRIWGRSRSRKQIIVMRLQNGKMMRLHPRLRFCPLSFDCAKYIYTELFCFGNKIGMRRIRVGAGAGAGAGAGPKSF